MEQNSFIWLLRYFKDVPIDKLNHFYLKLSFQEQDEIKKSFIWLMKNENEWTKNNFNAIHKFSGHGEFFDFRIEKIEEDVFISSIDDKNCNILTTPKNSIIIHLSKENDFNQTKIEILILENEFNQ